MIRVPLSFFCAAVSLEKTHTLNCRAKAIRTGPNLELSIWQLDRLHGDTAAKLAEGDNHVLRGLKGRKYFSDNKLSQILAR